MALQIQDTVTQVPASLWDCPQPCCGEDEVLSGPPRFQGPRRQIGHILNHESLTRRGKKKKNTFNKIPVDEEKWRWLLCGAYFISLWTLSARKSTHWSSCQHPMDGREAAFPSYCRSQEASILGVQQEGETVHVTVSKVLSCLDIWWKQHVF